MVSIPRKLKRTDGDMCTHIKLLNKAGGDERCKRCISESQRKEQLISSWETQDTHAVFACPEYTLPSPPKSIRFKKIVEEQIT